MQAVKIFSRVFSAFLTAILIFTDCSPKGGETLGGSGMLEAHQITLSAKEGGEIVELAVREGDAVRRGQLIARFDAEKLLIQRRQAEAALRELQLNMANARRSVRLALDHLELAEKNHRRIAGLLADNGATQQQFDEVDAALKAAQIQYENALTSLQALQAKEEQLKAQLDLLDSRIRDTELLAPSDGVILELYVEPGEVVRPFGPAANLADLSRMWVKIYLKEAELSRLKLGAPAKVFISSSKQPIAGNVTWISDQAEFTPKNVQTKEARADLTYAVKIKVDNPDGRLKIGMPVDVIIEPF